LSQTIIVPQNKLLQHLLRNPGTVFSIKSEFPNFSKTLLPLTDEFKEYTQELVCGEKGLFVIINGTSRVYKAINWNEKIVEFKRIDSSKFFGYNFGSLNFILKDSLLSFGGYGFWHSNGILRYFDERNEWDRIKLNKEIQFGSNVYSFNTIKSKLFWYVNIDNNDAITTNQILDSIYELNIPAKTITTLGHSSINLLAYSSRLSILTPNGLFFSDPKTDGKNVLLDLENNCVLKTATNKSNDYFKYLYHSNSINENTIFFYQNEYIYSTKYPFQQIDSVKFDISTFEKTNEKIYTPIDHKESIWHFNNLLFILVSIILIVVFFYLIQKKIIKSKFKNQIENPVEIIKESQNLINTTSKFEYALFSELEKSFINQLILRSQKNGFCTTDEINNLLGVSQKSVEIQKKARTDFITKINQSFKEFKNTDENFIKRVRSEKDKRSFNYSISAENQQLLNTIKN
jgi:hypothetical protein